MHAEAKGQQEDRPALSSPSPAGHLGGVPSILALGLRVPCSHREVLLPAPRCPHLLWLETSPPPQFCPVPQTCLYSIAAAVVAVTYPVCSGLLRLGVKERPGTEVQEQCGRQKLGAGLLSGMGLGLELCQIQMSPSCVADPSAPVSNQGMSFLAGLALTVRHPPYLKLVISFLLISAAVQVPQAGPVPTGGAPATLSCGGLVQSLIPPASVRLEFQ